MYSWTIVFGVEPSAPVADVSVLAWVPFTLAEAVEGVACAPMFAPSRDTVWLGSFGKKGVLLLKYSGCYCKYCKPKLGIYIGPDTGFVLASFLAKFVMIYSPTFAA